MLNFWTLLLYELHIIVVNDFVIDLDGLMGNSFFPYLFFYFTINFHFVLINELQQEVPSQKLFSKLHFISIWIITILHIIMKKCAYEVAKKGYLKIEYH